MVRFAVRRILATIPVLLVASALTFGLVDRAVDPVASLELRRPPVPESTVEARREALYLDRPVVDRYWLWLTGIGDTHGDIGLLRGRWGPSVRGVELGHEVRDRFLVTLRLAVAALVIALGLALVTGTIAARRRGSGVDRAVLLAGSVGIALPTFWLATLLKQGGVWVNERLGTRVLSTIGEAAPDHAQRSALGQVGDAAGHLLLPTLALLVGAYAVLVRHHRAATIEVLASDHVRLARAKGLTERAVLRRHVLRNSLLPVTAVTSLLTVGALSGAVVIEQTFRWRGMGTLLLDAVGAADPYAILAFLVVTTGVVLVAGLGADLVAAWLDPRTRRG